MIRILAAVIAVLLIGLSFLFYQNGELVEDNGRLQASVSQLTVSLSESESEKLALREDMKLRDRLIVDNRNAKDKLADLLVQRNQTIDGLIKRDEQVAEWADDRVPDAVLEQLRENSVHNENRDG